MNARALLKRIDISPDRKDMDELISESEKFVENLKRKIMKKKVDAEIFVGGSLAKGTIVKSKDYDVDIFFRFDKNYENDVGILNNSRKILNIIDSLRDPIRIMSDANKAHSMNYIQILSRLSKVYHSL